MSRYETLSLEEKRASEREPFKAGCRGRSLYTFNQPLRWYIAFVLLYALGAITALIWASRGPALSDGKRVLRTGAIPVDQFYSGLSLAGVLAPAAMLIRTMSNEFSSLQPFSIAATKPVRIADLDRMMDSGPTAVRTVFRYSLWRGLMRSVLLLTGALLVPVGTLSVTTGQYAPQTPGEAVVGMPILDPPMGFMGRLSSSMGYNGTGAFVGTYDQTDVFLKMVSDTFKGKMIEQRGLVPAAFGTLGPAWTVNITFEAGVRYEGVISYVWEGACKSAKDDIDYAVEGEGDESSIVFTYPDSSKQRVPLKGPSFFIWNNATAKTAAGVPRGGSTFNTVTSPIAAAEVIPVHAEGLDVINDTLIARIKCSPKMQWQVSSCQFDGNNMIDCIATPGRNTTALDTVGLDALSDYLNAVIWVLLNEPDFRQWTLAAIGDRVGLPDPVAFNDVVARVAESIASITTAGYYGTATVPTIGRPLEPVYIARMYVVAMVAVILIAVAAVSIADVVYNCVSHLPFRRTSFLTVSSAVRGSWWDKELYGRCTLRDGKLRTCGKTKVMFGVDLNNPEHVGLAPVVVEVVEDATYF